MEVQTTNDTCIMEEHVSSSDEHLMEPQVSSSDRHLMEPQVSSSDQHIIEAQVVSLHEQVSSNGVCIMEVQPSSSNCTIEGQVISEEQEETSNAVYIMEEQRHSSDVDETSIDDTYEMVEGSSMSDGVHQKDIEIKVEEDGIVEVGDNEEYEYTIEGEPCNVDYLQIATNEDEDVCHVPTHEQDEFTEQEVVSDGNFRIKSEGDENIEHNDAPCEFFMVSTVEEMREIINDYSERTSSHFVAWCKTKHFGLPSMDCDLSGHRIQWHDDRSVNNFIQYDGIPHVTIGHYELHCQFGVDKSAAQKEKRRKMKEEGELIVKSRTLKTPTKKCGCPAKIVVKHIIRFPEFIIDKDTKWKRNEASAKLKAKLKESRGEVVAEAIILGRLPDVSEHKYHEILQGKEFSKEVVSRDLAVKAQEYFLQNKSNTEILDALRDYVINEMFWNQEPPDFKRRKFFPTRKDIRNFNARVRHLSRFTPEEQESIRNIMVQTQVKDSNTNISFQIEEKCMNEGNDKPDSSDDEVADSESVDNSKGKKRKEERKVHSFVFCYQNPQQQRLMKRYSNVAYLLEIETTTTAKRILTYRLYALAVQTNVDFQVVGVVITSKQRKEGLLEGLTLFREWNNTWNPKYLLVDYSEAIFDAVLKVFPESNYFLNPHSCESKWLEFINTPSNNIREHSEEILTYLKNMQYSLTEDSLSIAAALLEGSEVWQKGEKLRTWFQTSWLHLAKKWVFGYRTEDLIIMQHLKLSINDCIYVYREALYQSAKLNGFIELLQNISFVISDSEYMKYIQRNNDHYVFYNQFRKSRNFPESMQGIPISLIPYVEGICRLAEANNFVITHDQLGLFTVRHEESVHNVDMPVPVNNVPLIHNGVLVTDSATAQTLIIANDQSKIADGGNGQHLIVTNGDGTAFCQDESNLIVLSHQSNQELAKLNGETSTILNTEVAPSTVSKDSVMTCSIADSTVDDVVRGSEVAGSVNEMTGEVHSEREIEVKETEFGWIEYSNKLTQGEFTISFGDSYSHPFCTCSHWLLYRLPCVHMFAVFCKVPGWRYDMLSPLYRVSPVLDIDYSCINFPASPQFREKECQTYLPGVCVETQTTSYLEDHIFESLNVKGLAVDHLLGQAKEFLQHVNKMSFLFKDKVLHRKIRVQLKELVDSLIVRCKKKESGMIFSELGNVIKQPSFHHKENGKPLKISTLNLEQIAESPGISRHAISDSRDAPKIIPKSNNEITVSMIELPDGRNLETVLQALSKNNPSLKVLSASRVFKSSNGDQKTFIKSPAVPNYSFLKQNERLAKVPSKTVIKNIAPNSDACEKPVVFKILPGATFNKGGVNNAALSDVETTIELDVNKAVPIHLERTPMDPPTKENATVSASLEDILTNGKRPHSDSLSPTIGDDEVKRRRLSDSLPELKEIPKTSYIVSLDGASENDEIAVSDMCVNSSLTTLNNTCGPATEIPVKVERSDAFEKSLSDTVAFVSDNSRCDSIVLEAKSVENLVETVSSIDHVTLIDPVKTEQTASSSTHDYG